MTTEVATIPTKENALTVFSAAQGLDPYLAQIRAEIDGFIPDITTKKGRDAIASIAHKVARSKTTLDNIGKELVAELKDVPKKIDAERKRMRDLLDAWKDEVRKPLDDWQAAEDKRVDEHNDGIQRIKNLAVFAETPTAAFVAQVIEDLELVELDDSWEEFLPEAAQAKDRSLKALRVLLADRTKHEAELAAIAKFNAEQAIREQQERDAAIAREAVEKAQREAEQRAQEERDAAAKREQDLIDQAAARQREAEQAARDAEAAAERQRLQLQLQAEQAERQAAQARADQLAAERRAEQDRIAAEQSQAAAVEQARLDELARQQAAADEIIRQQQEREADTKHKSKVMAAAKVELIKTGITEEQAKKIVLAICKGMIPNVAISF